MAIITIAIHSDKNDVDCKANLILHSKMEWKLSEFWIHWTKKKGKKYTWIGIRLSVPPEDAALNLFQERKILKKIHADR